MKMQIKYIFKTFLILLYVYTAHSINIKTNNRTVKKYNKCCEENFIFNSISNKCVLNTLGTDIHNLSDSSRHIGFPKCENGIKKGNIFDTYNVKLLRNSNKRFLNVDHCIETFIDDENRSDVYRIICRSRKRRKRTPTSFFMYVCSDLVENVYYFSSEWVPVLDDHSTWAYTLKTYAYYRVQPRGHVLKCPPDYLEITFHGDHKSSTGSGKSAFALDENAKLYHRFTDFDTTNYCLYKDYDKFNNSVIMAKTCVKPPVIPKCCGSNEIFDRETDTCKNVNKTVQFYPFIQFGAETMVWPQSLQGLQNQIHCQGNDTLTVVQITDESSLIKIHYSMEDLNMEFLWSSLNFPINLDPSLFCITPSNPDEISYSAVFCFNDIDAETERKCTSASCFRKCCKENYYFNLAETACSKSVPGYQWVDKFTNSTYTGNADLEKVYGYPICQDFFPMVDPTDEYILYPNGSLYIPLRNTSLHGDDYCMDNFVDSFGNLNSFPLVCFKDDNLPSVKEHSNSASLIISVVMVNVFPLIVLILYGSVKQWRDSMCKRILLTFVSLVICTDIFLLINHLDFVTFREACRFVAWLTYFSLFSSYFWFTLMCYDIWKIIRSSPNNQTRKKVSHRRFIHFAAVATVIPFILSTIGVTVSCLIYSEPSGFHLTGFGYYCACHTGHAVLLGIFWTIVIALLLINLGFLLHLCIWGKYRQRTPEEEANHRANASLHLRTMHNGNQSEPTNTDSLLTAPTTNDENA